VRDLPLPDDPVTAVILERLEQLKIQMSDLRKESREDRERTANRLTSLEAQIAMKLDPIKAAFEKTTGGYLMLVGMAGVIAWIASSWDHIQRVIHG